MTTMTSASASISSLVPSAAAASAVSAASCDFAYCRLKGFRPSVTKEFVERTFCLDGGSNKGNKGNGGSNGNIVVVVHEIIVAVPGRVVWVILRAPSFSDFRPVVEQLLLRGGGERGRPMMRVQGRTISFSRHFPVAPPGTTTTTTATTTASAAPDGHRGRNARGRKGGVDAASDSDSAAPVGRGARNNKNSSSSSYLPIDDGWVKNFWHHVVVEQKCTMCDRDYVSTLLDSYLVATVTEEDPPLRMTPLDTDAGGTAHHTQQQHQRRRRRLESAVMMACRRLKLARSRRLGTCSYGEAATVVVVFWAHPETLQFPSWEERQETIDRMELDRHRDQDDKEGVAVSQIGEGPSQQQRVHAVVGEQTTFALEVRYDPAAAAAAAAAASAASLHLMDKEGSSGSSAQTTAARGRRTPRTAAATITIDRVEVRGPAAAIVVVGSGCAAAPDVFLPEPFVVVPASNGEDGSSPHGTTVDSVQVRLLEFIATPDRIGSVRGRIVVTFRKSSSAVDELGGGGGAEQQQQARGAASTTTTVFEISRPFTVSAGLDAEMNRLLQPTSPYRRRRANFYRNNRRHKQQVAQDKIVGPPPQHQQQQEQEQRQDLPPGGGQMTRRRSANPFQNLPQYSIPADTVRTIQEGKYGDVLDSIGWSHVPRGGIDDGEERHDGGAPEGTTTEGDSSAVAGYGEFWTHMLHADEYQNWLDIQLFDMEGASLRRSGKHFILDVPGLAEGRPSVLRGDLVDVTTSDGVLYRGRVVRCQLLEVVLDFQPKFGQAYDPSVDRVHVRFNFSRMTLRTAHRACGRDGMAERHLGPALLAPTGATVEAIERERWDLMPSSHDDGAPSLKWANRTLNAEQQMAVQRIVSGALRPLPYIIFGPPGTGKTTAVVEAVYQLAREKKNILLVAPSNDAADILVERLSSLFPPSEMRRILAFSRSIASMPVSIQAYAKEMLDSPEQLDEIMSSKLIVATVNMAARFCYLGVPRGHFDVLVVDEAGHATEPEVVAVIASLMDFNDKEVGGGGGQLVLAGDPQQLGPIITSDLCRRYGMSVSYMERLMKRNVYGRQASSDTGDGRYNSGLLTKLVRNYRSHPAIIKLPNEMFYDNDLKCCGDMFATHNLAKWEHLPKEGFPVVFHAISGSNLREGNSPSWFNPEEAQQIVEYVVLLTRQSRPALKEEDIGIITPYARQAQKIRLALERMNVDTNRLKVGSVECFQGQERRVILLSTVRAEQDYVASDLRYNLGFVANPKRFNVALTRAKALLIVVGCPTVLALDKDQWLPFLTYCSDNGSWLGDEWDPADAAEILEQNEAEAKEDYENLYDAMGEMDQEDEAGEGEGGGGAEPSQVALQEGFVFVHREE